MGLVMLLVQVFHHFFWLQVAEGWGAFLPLFIGVLGTPVGALGGLLDGSSIPTDFEEPITIGANEWKIITEYDE